MSESAEIVLEELPAPPVDPEYAELGGIGMAGKYGLKQSGKRPRLSEYGSVLWQRRHFITGYATAKNRSLYSNARLGQLWQLLTPILNVGVYFFVFGVLLNHTVFGRNTLAIGGNPEAARLAGVKVERLRVLIFLLQGVVTAMAGLILSSRITSGQPNAAQGFELDVISACVLGGVSLQGGKARIVGVAVGVLIMGTVDNVMNLLNVDAFYQYLVRGIILLAAVLLDQLKTRGAR